MATRTSTAETTERLLDAADRLLARYGYRKMTIEDLAVEAGIGKGTVYLSFDSKVSVALGCIDRMVERLLARLRAIAAGPGTPASRLRAMMVERVLHRFDYARPHSRSLDDLLSSIRPRFLERRAAYFRAESEVLATVVEEGRRTGAFATRDPRAAAEALVLATNALLPYSLSARELGRRAEIARRAEAIADLVLDGLVSHGARAARRHPRPRRSLPS
jgi:AcrR family transcriptional regulator